MASTRQRKKVFTNVTLDVAEKASRDYAFAANKLQKIEAKMNADINKVKEKYQNDITSYQETLQEPMEILHVYAKEQKDTWGKRKSFDLLHSVIGFRTGTPKVTKQKGFTWEAITEIVSKLFPELIRTKNELDKETIIAMRNEDSMMEIKEKCYINVEQDETFYVEVKEEEIVMG